MQQQYQCSNCGAHVAFGTRFCGNCGIQLNWPAQQQIQQPMEIAIPLGRNIGLIKDKAFMASAGGIGMAMTLIQQGKSGEALQYIDKVLDTDQNLAMAWWVKGEALDRLERLPEAIKCYDKAIACGSIAASRRGARGSSSSAAATSSLRWCMTSRPASATDRTGCGASPGACPTSPRRTPGCGRLASTSPTSARAAVPARRSSPCAAARPACRR